MNVQEFIEDRRLLISNGMNDTEDLEQALEIIESQRAALEKIDGHIISDSSGAAALFQEIARRELERTVEG